MKIQTLNQLPINKKDLIFQETKEAPIEIGIKEENKKSTNCL